MWETPLPTGFDTSMHDMHVLASRLVVLHPPPTCPVLLVHALQGFLTGSCRDSIQRLLPNTGTMPSTSPLNTHSFRAT